MQASLIVRLTYSSWRSHGDEWHLAVLWNNIFSDSNIPKPYPLDYRLICVSAALEHLGLLFLLKTTVLCRCCKVSPVGGGGPDCIVFCALCITKDLHMLKFGTVVFSLKHPASIYFCTQKCLRCHLCVSPKICVETQIWPLLCLAVWMAPPARWSREHKKALVQWFCDNKL